LLESPPQADGTVIDLRLPGIDGLTLIERLRAGGARMPAILITTTPTSAAAAAGQAEIVEKPLVTGELRLRIARGG
jgi:CheY-like chemotaxis protein